MSKRKDMLEVIANSMDKEMIPFLIEWILDTRRKPAVVAFTSGSVRDVAYAVERALYLERETHNIPKPLKMRPTEQCPRCGYIQTIFTEE